MQQYLFGYGSLFSTRSRGYTAPASTAVLAVLHGYKRGWYFHDKEFNYSAVGIRPDKKARCNGVLIPVHADHLPAYDKREEGYERVDVTDSVVLSSEKQDFEKNSKIWTYVIKKIEEPCADFPIVQSYLDLTLAGCMEHGISQVKEFVSTTAAWNKCWVNDRTRPIFKRGLANVPFQAMDAHLAPVLSLRRDYSEK